MMTATATSTAPREVLVLGRIPPPVTGMTLFTQEVLAGLKSKGPVDFINWSVGATRRTLFTRLRYVARAVGSIAKMLARGRVDGQRLFLVANSQAGLYSTAAVVFVAARLGYAIHLHHHVYSYINHFDRRMAWIDRWMGPRGVHVVHCEKMIRDFRARYRSQREFAIIFPSAVTIEVRSPRQFPARVFRLGLLSNLTIAKGLTRAIDTAAALHAAGRRVELVLAGPVLEPAAKQCLDVALQQFPDLITYRGPLYDADKTDFFAQIDAFLFPTEYQHESWGIVLNEALAAGVPIVTNDRGCSSIVVGDRAGLVVQNPEDYVPEAVAQIERWLDHPDEYQAASAAAIEQADFLNREGRRTLSEFAAHMFSPPGRVDGQLLPA
jgi:glycosyltransferase involved in cell wall biosynthesis